MSTWSAQTVVNLRSVDYRAGASFRDRGLSINGDVNLKKSGGGEDLAVVIHRYFGTFRTVTIQSVEIITLLNLRCLIYFLKWVVPQL